MRAFIEQGGRDAYRATRAIEAYQARAKRERAELLSTLRRESAYCSGVHCYADESTAPKLAQLGRLAAHYQGKSVVFEGVTFPITYSAWRGAVRDPATREALVLFSCSW